MNYNNFAQKTNFIASSNAFEHLPFYLTSLNVPGVNLTHPEVGGRAATKMKVSSDTIQ